MQRLDLNLASNPFRNNMLLWIGYSLAMALLITFSIWNVRSYVEYRGKLLELRDTVGTFETQRLDLDTRAIRAQEGIRDFDLEALEVQAAKANEVIGWKAFSWTRLFNELERIQPHQVKMSTVRPIFNASQRTGNDEDLRTGNMPVAIEGTARRVADFLELEHALQDDSRFGRVEPDRITKAKNGEIVFQLRFLYYPSEGEAVPEGEADGLPAEEPGVVTAAGETPAAPGSMADGQADPAQSARRTEVGEPWTGGDPAGEGEVQSAAPAREPIRSKRPRTNRRRPPADTGEKGKDG
jgi:hypothetical protein